MAPITEVEYLHGTNVVQIGDFRAARGEVRRPYSPCQHLNVNYNLAERRVWCKDCEQDVESFDAFMLIVRRYSVIEERIAELRRVESETVRSRAAKAFDEVYRSRTMIPCCPHCNRGILPHDVINGMGRMNKELEERRRGGGGAEIRKDRGK